MKELFGGKNLVNEEAIKELERSLEALKNRSYYHEDNRGKLNAILNEIEVNEIAVRLMKSE